MVLLSLLIGCVEYGFENNVDNTTPESTDTALEDTGENSDDTADTGEEVVVATAKVYANTSGELFEINPRTSEHVRIGAFHTAGGQSVEQFTDIAIDLNGRMVGGTFDAIYIINPETAEVAKVCDTDIEMMALAFDSDGRLFAGGDFIIREVSLPDCRATTLLDNVGFQTSGDLVGLPDGYLYWTVRGDNGDDLVRVDPSYGYTSWVGHIGVEKLYGLGYDDGILFGFNSRGNIAKISPSSGYGTITGGDSQTSWWGATTNPVVW